jgi:hypothetical protein
MIAYNARRNTILIIKIVSRYVLQALSLLSKLSSADRKHACKIIVKNVEGISAGNAIQEAFCLKVDA